MPVYRDGDELVIALEFPRGTFLPANQVHSTCEASGAYATCETLGQLPTHVHLSTFPEAVLAHFGDTPMVRAFAHLGWLRGRMLQTVELREPKERRARRERITSTVVRIPDAVQHHPAAPLATSKPAPVRKSSATPAGDLPPGTPVLMPASAITMRKQDTSRLKVETRAALRNLGEHRWVGQRLDKVQRLLSSRLMTAGYVRDLEVLRWTTAISSLADFA